MKRLWAFIISLALLTGLAFLNPTLSVGASTGGAVQKKVQSLKKARNVFSEALQAIAYTDKAIVLLSAKKPNTKEALSILKEAETKLERFLSTHKNLSMLPVDQQIVVVSFGGTYSDAKHMLEKARKMLDEGRVQDARYIIDQLTDEIDVVNTYLPIAMYRHVLALATKDIKQGKIKDALAVLALVRGSLVIDKIVIPTPFLKAEAYIDKASSQKEKKKAIEFLKEAENQLKLAKLLGYAYDFKDEYASIEKQIEKLKKAVQEGKSTKSMFTSLKKRVHGLSVKAQKRQ